MEISAYFERIVEPTIADLEAQPTSVRHAFLACVATFHAVDYMQARGHRRSWQIDCPAFALVDRVAHALKHVRSDGGAAGPAGRLHVDEVIPRPPATWGAMVWGLSAWDDADGGVTLTGERQVDVLNAVREAAAFLRSKATAPALHQT